MECLWGPQNTQSDYHQVAFGAPRYIRRRITKSHWRRFIALLQHVCNTVQVSLKAKSATANHSSDVQVLQSPWQYRMACWSWPWGLWCLCPSSIPLDVATHPKSTCAGTQTHKYNKVTVAACHFDLNAHRAQISSSKSSSKPGRETSHGSRTRVHRPRINGTH